MHRYVSIFILCSLLPQCAFPEGIITRAPGWMHRMYSCTCRHSCTCSFTAAAGDFNTFSLDFGKGHLCVWLSQMIVGRIKEPVCHHSMFLHHATHCATLDVLSSLYDTNHRITDSLRLKKTTQITMSNCQSIPTMPMDHVPHWHICTVLEYLQGQSLHRLPVQPIPVHYDSF